VVELETGPHGVGGTAADLLLVVPAGTLRMRRSAMGGKRRENDLRSENRWSLASAGSGVQPLASRLRGVTG